MAVQVVFWPTHTHLCTMMPPPPPSSPQAHYHLGDLVAAQAACERLTRALEAEVDASSPGGGGAEGGVRGTASAAAVGSSIEGQFAAAAVAAVIGVPSSEGVSVAFTHISKLLHLKVRGAYSPSLSSRPGSCRMYRSPFLPPHPQRARF